MDSGDYKNDRNMKIEKNLIVHKQKFTIHQKSLTGKSEPLYVNSKEVQRNTELSNKNNDLL